MSVLDISDAVIEAAPGPLATRTYKAAETGKAAGLVLHLHGGTFNDGSLDSGRAVATVLAEAGAHVVSLAYPLAPAHPFPSGLEAVFGALVAIAKERARRTSKAPALYVAGEEAGGNLAAAIALMARDRGEPLLAGQILFSPMLDACLGTYSLRTADAGPVGCRWADGWNDYLGSPERAAHPYAAPLGASRLAGVAPALIVTAEDDPLRDECASYAARLRQAGVKVDHLVRPAPSDWPAAYSKEPQEGCCLFSVRDALRTFFTTTGPP